MNVKYLLLRKLFCKNICGIAKKYILLQCITTVVHPNNSVKQQKRIRKTGNKTQ